MPGRVSKGIRVLVRELPIYKKREKASLPQFFIVYQGDLGREEKASPTSVPPHLFLMCGFGYSGD